jgi:hypothetical protein
MAAVIDYLINPIRRNLRVEYLGRSQCDHLRKA